MQSDLSPTPKCAVAMLLAGSAKVRIVRIERGKRRVSVVCIVIERIALRLLHDFVSVIVVNIGNLCSPVVGFSLDDRRSCCCLPRLTILRAIIRRRLDCSRYMPIIFVLVVALHIIVTLLLWHNLLLRRVYLIKIAISAVTALVCESTS
jgi:hypothetical protein